MSRPALFLFVGDHPQIKTKQDAFICVWVRAVSYKNSVKSITCEPVFVRYGPYPYSYNHCVFLCWLFVSQTTNTRRRRSLTLYYYIILYYIYICMYIYKS